MCASCGCGFATYDDLETGAPGKEAPKQQDKLWQLVQRGNEKKARTLKVD